MKKLSNSTTRFLNFIYAAQLLLFLIVVVPIVSFLAVILILSTTPLTVYLKVSGKKPEKVSSLVVLGSTLATFVLLILMLKELMVNLLG